MTYSGNPNYSLSSLVGKKLFLHGDSTKTYTLAASLIPVRYDDYSGVYSAYSVVTLLQPENYDTSAELCVRVKENQDVDFKARLKADSEKQFRIGNVFISEVTSFKDIRRNFQQITSNDIRNYLTGMGFLMLNIFLGLLGTFWFRTQQRRCEIALHMAMGSTAQGVFRRLMSEALLLLLLATLCAVCVDYYLVRAELNAWFNGSHFEPERFVTTVAITFFMNALMIVVGIWIPGQRAMRIQPAEALHDE